MARRSITSPTASIGGFFYQALHQASKSTYMYKLGAVVLNKGKVTGKGCNSLKSHSGLRKDYGYYSCHAETAALRNAGGCGDTLVVARIGRNGVVSCAKPCSKCLQYMKDKGIKKVFYTNWEGRMEMMRVK